METVVGMTGVCKLKVRTKTQSWNRSMLGKGIQTNAMLRDWTKSQKKMPIPACAAALHRHATATRYTASVQGVIIRSK